VVVRVSTLFTGLLALFVLAGQRRGWFSTAFTLTFFCTLLIVVLVAIVWLAERERQKVESRRADSEQRLRLALRSGAIGIWELHPHRREHRWDARCREIFGFPPDFAIDAKTIVSCIHPEDLNLVRQKTHALFDAAGSGHFEVHCRIVAWNDHSLRHIYAQGQTVFAGTGATRSIRLSIGTLQDVTALRQGERALRRAHTELEQFAYAAAHDLQEPLRNIGLATQSFAQRYRDIIDDEGNELLKVSVEGSFRMQAMIKDLLKYLRVLKHDDQSTGLAKSDAVLARALQNLQAPVLEKQALLSFDTLPAVRMSDLHLLQIFQNLVENSLRFSGNSRPVIHIASTYRSGVCVFYVRDDGPGIPAEFHERVFGVFKRLQLVDRPGTGVGLALCKRIVEHYGGRIWIESSPGGGTTVLFTPPLANEKTFRTGAAD
jgi:signal transduction histidine kinase